MLSRYEIFKGGERHEYGSLEKMRCADSARTCGDIGRAAEYRLPMGVREQEYPQQFAASVGRHAPLHHRRAVRPVDRRPDRQRMRKPRRISGAGKEVRRWINLKLWKHSANRCSCLLSVPQTASRQRSCTVEYGGKSWGNCLHLHPESTKYSTASVNFRLLHVQLRIPVYRLYSTTSNRKGCKQ